MWLRTLDHLSNTIRNKSKYVHQFGRCDATDKYAQTCQIDLHGVNVWRHGGRDGGASARGARGVRGVEVTAAGGRSAARTRGRRRRLRCIPCHGSVRKLRIRHLILNILWLFRIYLMYFFSFPLYTAYSSLGRGTWC